MAGFRFERTFKALNEADVEKLEPDEILAVAAVQLCFILSDVADELHELNKSLDEEDSWWE